MQIFAAGWDYFVKGGIVMYPLLCCSLYVVAIGFERYLFYKKFDNGKQFTKQLCNLLEQGDWQQAKNLTDDTQGEVAKLATIVMTSAMTSPLWQRRARRCATSAKGRSRTSRPSTRNTRNAADARVTSCPSMLSQ